jgi:hypothetical protein
MPSKVVSLPIDANEVDPASEALSIFPNASAIYITALF